MSNTGPGTGDVLVGLAAVSAEMIRASFERSPLPMMLMGLDGSLLAANEAWHTFTQTPRGSRWVFGGDSFLHHEDMRGARALFERFRSGEVSTFTAKRRFVRTDGAVVYGITSTTAVHDERGGLSHLFVVLTDVTEEEHAASLVDASASATAVVGVDGRFLNANDALCQLLGRQESELRDTSSFELFEPSSRPAAGEAFRSVAMQRQQRSSCDATIRTALGDRRVEVRVTRMPDHDDRVIVNVHDITDRQALADQLRHQADHDALTGVLNRRAFDRQLAEHLARSCDHPRGALLVLDVDHFKSINDSHGHVAGDAAIVAVAGALRSRLRSSDVIARLGGDEFAVLLPTVDADEAQRVADAIVMAVRQAPMPDAPSVQLTTSVGIVMISCDHGAVDAVVADADAAMYAAKSAGRDQWVRLG
jgi:diguanylate cyclase (GGDEF)-like protein/PAS domain S-box-containing protein